MPIATVELLVEKAYLVVGFRPAYKLASATLPSVYLIDRKGALPVGLYDFSPAGECVQTPHLVTLQLPRDGAGKVGVLTMMVAADWLADQGWEVVPLGWCKDVFERVRGAVAAG